MKQSLWQTPNLHYMYNLPAQPTAAEQEEDEFGPIQLEWTYPEFTKHQRGIWWYIGSIGIGLTILTFSILNANYLLAIAVILIGFTLLNYHRHDPRPIPFQIRHKGIKVGGTFLPFSALQSFWIVYDPPHIKTLYFLRKARLRNEISIPLIEANPITVREHLESILPEDLTKETETPNDSLARILKIH